MFMLVLLKSVGWFLAAYILGTVAISMIFKLFMMFFGHTWSVRSACRYLDSHGRGNRQEENFRAIVIDIFTRMMWVLVFAIASTVLGCLFLPNLALKIGFLMAVLCFFVLIGWIEMHYSIRIGRLASVDDEGRVAYFESLDGIGNLDVFYFTYDYDGNREFLCDGMKYVVVDYVCYKMFVIADKYEWGNNL